MGKDSEQGSVPEAHTQFNAIFIIESLPDKDIHTGKKLYEDVFPSLTANNKDPLVTYSHVASKAEFLFALGSMAACVDEIGLYPILHIECHGEDNGLRMSNNDFVSYEEMTPVLRDVNGLMKNSLLVVISACFGAYLASSMTPTRPAPVWLLLGPVRNAKARVLLVAYEAFYDSLLRRLSMNEAVSAIYAAGTATHDLFKIVYSEELFLRAFNRSLDEDGAKKIVAQCLSIALCRGMSSSQYDQREAEYLALVRSEEWKRKQFDRVRKRFLHIDSFPENASRFNLTYDDLSSFDLQKGQP